MPVELKGSCHCGAVKFSLQSSTPIPYQVCGQAIVATVDLAVGPLLTLKPSTLGFQLLELIYAAAPCLCSSTLDRLPTLHLC
jgi:hypothetical protein